MSTRKMNESEVDQVMFRIYQAAEHSKYVIPERVMYEIKDNLKSVDIG